MDKDLERLETQLAQEKELSEALTVERDKAVEERNSLVEKADQYDALEADRDDLVERLQEKDEEISALNSQVNDVSDQAWKAAQYDVLHDVIVANTVKQYVKAKGESLREGDTERERTRLEGTTDITLIMKWHAMYKKDYLDNLRKPSTSSVSRAYSSALSDEIDIRAFE